MQKFPKIISYLEAHRPDVFELFNTLGMHGDLNPKRAGSITFLCPDAALAAEIKAVIEGPNPENATDMLASLILTDLYGSPSDMTDGNVRTHLGKLLPVKRIGSKDVSLTNGALVSPHIDPPFIPFSRKAAAKRDNMAVWMYSGPMWDYENGESADAVKPKKAVVAAPTLIGSKTGARKRLTKVVVGAAAQYYSVNTPAFVIKDGVNNPFIRASACILSNLRGDMVAMARVMPFIFAPCRAIMFYALVTLVDEEILNSCSNWQNARSPYDMNLINSCLDEWMEFTASENPKPVLATKEGQMAFFLTLARFIKDTPKSNLIHKKEMQAIDQVITSNKFVNLGGLLSKGSAVAVRELPNMFKLVNFASYELVGQLDEVTGEGDVDAVALVLREFDRYYGGTKEAIAARVEGHESYDKMSNEFSNEDWQHVKRARFCNSLLWSLPMHRDVAVGLLEKMGEEDNIVSRKANSSNVIGAAEVGISNSTRSELREYLRTKGGNHDALKDLL
jgi:hypothetical protein